MSTQTITPVIVSFGAGRHRAYIKIVHSKTSNGKHLISTTQHSGEAKEFDSEEKATEILKQLAPVYSNYQFIIEPVTISASH
jgi:hypothetical protein